MKIQQTSLPGLFHIQSIRLGDERGEFSRLFCEQEFARIRASLHFSQVNLSATSHKGTVRGLHYQNFPAAEAKLIRCLRGSVFDVAVDIRAGSSTFLQWNAIELSEDNDLAAFIPEGFAHGFQALTDGVQLLYSHTAPWAPNQEAGLRFDDSRLAIAWPLPVTLVSVKDRAYPLIGTAFAGIRP